MCPPPEKKTAPSSSTTKPTTTITDVYLVIWCLHLFQPFLDLICFGKGSGGLDSRPIVQSDYYYLLPAVVTTLIAIVSSYGSSKSTRTSTTPHYISCAVVAHVLDLIIRYHRFPAVWDHEIWGYLINVTFTLCYLPYAFGSSNKDSNNNDDNNDDNNHDNNQRSLVEIEDIFLKLTRLQLGFFYTAATFWKINSSFMDPITSCGTVLILELIGAYTKGLLPESVTNALIPLGPHLTLVVEGVLAIGMFYTVWGQVGSSTNKKKKKKKKKVATYYYCRDGTVLLGVIFHLSIFMMPVNSAGGFSLECMTRFILLFSSYEINQAHDWFLNQQWKNRPRSTLAWFLFTPLGLIIARYNATLAPFDIGYAFASVLLVYYCFVVAGYGSYTDSPKTMRSPTPGGVSIWAQALTLGLTFFYCFVTPILGVMQMSAPTMYSNMRYYKGGNHYLVPTAILGEDILYGGGLVQVVKSTSWSVNTLLGYIPSDLVFPKDVVDILQPTLRVQADGNYRNLPLQLFPMCMFNPHSREVLMDDYIATNSPTNSLMLTPFTIPISAIKKALREANERNETFVVELSDNLDPSPNKFVRISSSGRCKVHGSLVGDCTNNKLARLVLGQEDDPGVNSFWRPLVNKLLVPYPQLVGTEKEICMS